MNAMVNKLTLEQLQIKAAAYTVLCGFQGKIVEYSDDVLLLMGTDTRIYDLVFAVWKESHRAFFDKSNEHCFFLPCVSETNPEDFLGIEGYSLCLSILYSPIDGYYYFVDAY